MPKTLVSSLPRVANEIADRFQFTDPHLRISFKYGSYLEMNQFLIEFRRGSAGTACGNLIENETPQHGHLDDIFNIPAHQTVKFS